MSGQLLEFSALSLTDRPNQYLVAPEGLCRNAEPHEFSPDYPVSAPVLFDAWREVVNAVPRTTIKAVNQAGLEIEAVQHSALFRFRDRINFAAFAADKDHSNLAVYSRSLVGYSDFGANRARIRRWLDMLERTLATG